jgi:hypothetical protein
MPGNLIILGDDEAKAMLHAEPALVDVWLSGLVDDISDFAAERLRVHAPGRIDQLVDAAHDLPGEAGAIEATAGVIPDITEGNFNRGLGSDPADWPVFVDVGTGVYGAHGSPIRSIPGNVMVFEADGQRIFARQIKGQPAQHYSDRAFEDTVGWTPARIELAAREFAAAHPG